MKEVVHCSIAGIAFTLEADAHALLGNYLRSLGARYGETADGTEILADIEARIAELILAEQEAAQVVGRPLAERIVAQLGSADAISDESGEPAAGSGPRIPRRLYRDMGRARLGGVCAGAGRYFNIDPVWLRLGLFVPLLLACAGWIPGLFWLRPVMGNLFGLFVLSYLVLWFAVPAARTPRQKLEMTGERITERSIRDTAAAPDSEERARSAVAEAVAFAGRALLVILKILVGAVLAGLVLGACALVFGLVFVATEPESLPGAGALLGPAPSWLAMWGIGVALVPVVGLIYLCTCLIASRKPRGGILLAFVLAWAVTLGGCCWSALRCGGAGSFGERHRSVERILESETIVDGDTTTLREVLDGRLPHGDSITSLRILVRTTTAVPPADSLPGSVRR